MHWRLASKRQERVECLWKVSNQVYHRVRWPLAMTSSFGMGVCSSAACNSCIQMTPVSLQSRLRVSHGLDYVQLLPRRQKR